MKWNADHIEGSDDIPSFFHFPKGFLFVIKEEEYIVGCGGVKPLDDSTGVIKRFYIASHLRGKGIAKKLLEKILKEGKEKNYFQLVLDVYYKNIRALKFYEKQGFIQYHQKSSPDWEESLSPDNFFFTIK